MINKYTFGKPFETQATVIKLPEAKGNLPFFTVNEGQFSYNFSEGDIVYGLGEQIRGINKRGWKYVSWNYDNPHHQEDTVSLYGSHNFIIIRGRETFGAFFDFPGKITWDIGYSHASQMHILVAKPDLDLYIITSDSDHKELDIVKQFRELIGKSYVPPMWAFGYGQSRWGYMNEADIREVASKYKEAGVPLDSIYMDIDYMDAYKDFSVNSDRFPDLAGLVEDMKAEGIHLVPIIDAGVKIDKDYDCYKEGVENNYFCKDTKGKDFVGAVWPGRVHFPDFMQPKARDWFGSKYKALTDLGIDGFWNDMNEPAIFYTEDQLQEAFDRVSELAKAENIGINEFFALTGLVGGLNGNESSYYKFFHNIDGQMVNHSEIHNLYGFNMTRAASEALEKLSPDKKILFFSRSSYIGAHRYGGIWQGDNKSWWSHILQGMQQLPALNMAGFMYIGSDTCGFGSDTTEDLVMRWLQFAIFTPLFRNHSANGTRFQELYRFDNYASTKEMVKIRYSLIPYLYNTFLKAVDSNDMMFKPLSFVFNKDKDAETVEDQLLLGDELMIAPIYKQNARGRYVYLPEEMMKVTMTKWNECKTEILPAGHHYVPQDLNELVFYIRQGRKLELVEPKENCEKLDSKPALTIGY